VDFLSLTNRVAVVTGGAQGIGMAIAERLLLAGASGAIVDVNPDGAQRAAASLAVSGRSVSAFQCDVSDPASVRRTFDAIEKQYSRIDILVNSAGVGGPIGPIQEVTDDQWRRVIEINLSGTFYCCRAVIPQMISRGYGRIINISSIAGKGGRPNMAAYSATKAGVIAFTKAVAKEVAGNGVTVNVVTPGAIDTPILSDLTPQETRSLIEKIPIGRMGRPEEVAALVHWIASDDATLSTGAVFDLTGGRTGY
jgi:2-dehydro-3-deoxy-L-rhamnonate dehydrogenase (NAD+)